MEATDIPVCRICMDEEQTSNLISPCNCRGSMAFIHRHCLDQWYEIRQNEFCGTCHYYYATEWCGIKPISEWWKLPPYPRDNVQWNGNNFVQPPAERVKKSYLQTILKALFTSLLYAIFLRYYKEDLLFGLSPKLMMASDSIFILIGVMSSLKAILATFLLIFILYLWIDSLMIYQWKNKSDPSRMSWTYPYFELCLKTVIFAILYALIDYTILDYLINLCDMVYVRLFG
uniref:RING-CH-type domain-containing protein n=1 Tax=Acrobeloides nanus TaxID=290746 RepID=A0A914CJ07_9BILA